MKLVGALASTAVVLLLSLGCAPTSSDGPEVVLFRDDWLSNSWGIAVHVEPESLGTYAYFEQQRQTGSADEQVPVLLSETLWRQGDAGRRDVASEDAIALASLAVERSQAPSGTYKLALSAGDRCLPVIAAALREAGFEGAIVYAYPTCNLLDTGLSEDPSNLGPMPDCRLCGELRDFTPRSPGTQLGEWLAALRPGDLIVAPFPNRRPALHPRPVVVHHRRDSSGSRRTVPRAPPARPPRLIRSPPCRDVAVSGYSDMIPWSPALAAAGAASASTMLGAS